MENYTIYEDIANRTNGDIYIGVVGPVRCGKSMFISKFMKNLVIPNIKNKHSKERAIDELPQSAEGKTIMTTQPNFVPNEAVNIMVGPVQMKVRMIDCVGYMISGALGHEENLKPRLVKTPWSKDEMPFEEAAEIGTRKVIEEHSTIGLMITTDGSITDISRESYVDAEQRIVEELKQSKKPFVVVLNTTKPQAEETIRLQESLKEKYSVPVLAVDVSKLNEENVEEIFENVLSEFPIKSFKARFPKWLEALPYDDDIIQEIRNELISYGENARKIGELDRTKIAFLNNDNFEPLVVNEVLMGEGAICFDIVPKPNLFYKVLSKQCGIEIDNDFTLVKHIKELAHAKVEYDKLADALKQVEETGYGIVSPKIEEMTLEDPQIVKQGTRFGVKLKASAPSLHIMKVDVETEVSPLVGTQQQSEELCKYLMDEFEKNPSSIWNTNMFGKSLHTLVNDGINSKIVQMPFEAQRKMRKTLSRIVNEGKGGIICILL